MCVGERMLIHKAVGRTVFEVSYQLLSPRVLPGSKLSNPKNKRH